jgi:hypothetical protein
MGSQVFSRTCAPLLPGGFQTFWHSHDSACTAVVQRPISPIPPLFLPLLLLGLILLIFVDIIKIADIVV